MISPGSAAQPVDGSKRHALSFSGDAVYMFSPEHRIEHSRLLQRHRRFVRRAGSHATEASDLEAFWPGNAWYKPYLEDLPDIYYPGISVRVGFHVFAKRLRQRGHRQGGYWYQEPDSYNIQSKAVENIGRHFVKVGVDFRKDLTNAARPRPMSFDFRPD